MKRKNKVFYNKKIDLKLCSSILSGTVLLTGFMVYKNDDKNEVKSEINIIDSYEETSKDKTKIINSNIEYTYTELEPQSSDYYSSIEIGGRTLHFANTPTPTPTPINPLVEGYTDEMIIGEDGIYPEGYFDYLDRKEHTLNFKTTDEMISFYSKVFELDENVSSKVIKDIIGNQELPLDEEIELNGTDYNSLEEGIARILNDLSNYPEEYGYSEDEIRSDEDYQLDYYYAEELIYKFSTVLDVNPYIAMAIAYGESGRKLDSYIFVNNHNPGGIVSGSGFAKYRNEASGMFSFVKLLHDRYFVRGDSDYDRLKAMANGYCEEPSHWISLVGSIYFELCDNGYGSTFYNFRYEDRDLIYCDEEELSFYKSKYYTLKKDEN